MSTFPQYAKSTDPDVIATIEQNQKHEAEFREKVSTLSEKWTGSPGNAWINRSGTGSSFIGLRMTREQIDAAPGQWKKPGRNGEYRPYKSNPIAPEFSLRAKHEEVPGRPDLLWSIRTDGDGRMGPGAVFIHDGAAWSGCGFTPDAPADDRWVEVLASEFHAALEAVNAR